MATNIAAALVLMMPEGISLLMVLGLSESKSLSASLLNPIAVFLAKIIQRMTRSSNLILKSNSGFDTASEKPMRAKGIAKTVCLNFTREK
jgi:ammonia channel protein AmtB